MLKNQLKHIPRLYRQTVIRQVITSPFFFIPLQKMQRNLHLIASMQNSRPFFSFFHQLHHRVVVGNIVSSGGRRLCRKGPDFRLIRCTEVGKFCALPIGNHKVQLPVPSHAASAVNGNNVPVFFNNGPMLQKIRVVQRNRPMPHGHPFFKR